MFDEFKKDLQQGVNDVGGFASNIGHDIAGDFGAAVHAAGQALGITGNSQQPQQQQPSQPTPRPQQFSPQFQAGQSGYQPANNNNTLNKLSVNGTNSTPANPTGLNVQQNPTAGIRVAPTGQSVNAGLQAQQQRIAPIKISSQPLQINPQASPPPMVLPSRDVPGSGSQAPAPGDTAGLTKALRGLANYTSDDQARIVNRSAQAGLLPHNYAAALQNDILSPGVNVTQNKGQDLLNSFAATMPGVEGLAKSLGTNLAANKLYNQQFSGKVDPDIVQNTVNEAMAESGHTPNQSVGSYARQQAGNAIMAVPETLSGGILGGAEATALTPTLMNTAQSAAKFGVGFGLPSGVGQALAMQNPTGSDLLKNVGVNIAQAAALPAAFGVGAVALHNLPDIASNFRDTVAQHLQPLDETGGISNPFQRKFNGLPANQVIMDTNKLDTLNDARAVLTTGTTDVNVLNKVYQGLHQIKDENGLDFITGTNPSRLQRITQYLEQNGDAIPQYQDYLSKGPLMKPLNEIGAVGRDVTGGQPNDPLAALKQEALKYKSADEFVNSLPTHGAPAEHIDSMIKNGYKGQGNFHDGEIRGMMTTHFDSKNYGSNKLATLPKSDANILRGEQAIAFLKQFPTDMPKRGEAITQALKKSGYDAIAPASEHSMVWVNPEKANFVKLPETKQELKNLYNQAHNERGTGNGTTTSNGLASNAEINSSSKATRNGEFAADNRNSNRANDGVRQNTQQLTDLYNQAHAEATPNGNIRIAKPTVMGKASDIAKGLIKPLDESGHIRLPGKDQEEPLSESAQNSVRSSANNNIKIAKEGVPAKTPGQVQEQRIGQQQSQQNPLPEISTGKSGNLKVAKTEVTPKLQSSGVSIAKRSADLDRQAQDLLRQNRPIDEVTAIYQKEGMNLGDATKEVERVASESGIKPHALENDINSMAPAGKGNMEDLTDKQAASIAQDAKNARDAEVMNLVQRHSILDDAIKKGVSKGEDDLFDDAVEHPEARQQILSQVKKPEAFLKAVLEQENFNRYAYERTTDTGTPLEQRENYLHHNVDLSDPAEAQRFEEMASARGRLSQPGYSQPRVFNDVRELKQAGFKLKYDNARDRAKDYANSVAHTLSRNALINTVKDEAPGHITTVEGMNGRIPVDNNGGEFATGRTNGLNRVFLSPAMVKAVSRYVEPTDLGVGLKTIDAVNQTLKQSTLALGGFHDFNMTKRYVTQEVASGLTGEPKRLLNTVIKSAQQDAAFWSKSYYARRMQSFRDSGLLDRATLGNKTPLTLGKNLDVGSLNKKVEVGTVADKSLSVGKKIAVIPSHVNEFLHSFLFSRKIPVMKLDTAAAEYKRAGIPLKGELTPAQRLKVEAINHQVNSMYGGITKGFIAKTNIGKFVQRQLMLAPDFTGGNINSLINMGKGGAKGLAWRQNVGNYLASVIVGGVATGLVAQAQGQNGVKAAEKKMIGFFNPKSPDFMSPNFTAPFKDSKGRSLKITMPGSPIEEGYKMRDLVHFAESRGGSGVSDLTKYQTNQNYDGQPLVDPFKHPNPTAADKLKAVLSSNLPIPAANGVQLNHGAQNVATTVLNTVGFRVGKDPNDPKVQAEQQYYTAIDKGINSLTPNDKAAYNVVHPTIKDRNGNYVIAPTVFDTTDKAATYLAHPDVLAVDNKVNKALQAEGQKVDPFFTTLTPQQQQDYLAHQLVNKNNTQQLTEDKQRYSSWLPAFDQARAAFYASLPPGDPNKPKSPIGNPPPQSQDVQAAFQQYDSMTDPTQRAQFFGAHPELAAYENQSAAYTNQELIAQHLTPLKPYPTADADTTAYTQAYMNGTKAQRAAMRTGNPAGYQAMQGYLQNVDEYEVTKNGALDQLQGQTPNQPFLKGMKSLVNYDMAQNPDGSLTLKYGSVNPGATTYGSVGEAVQPGAVSVGAGSGSSSSKRPMVANPRRLKVRKTYAKRPPRIRKAGRVYVKGAYHATKGSVSIGHGSRVAKPVRIANA